MSKYTTEVRYICEVNAGLTESKGYSSIEEILDAAAPLIFNFDFPIFDEDYRLPLEKKILRHFYTREICEETVGLWKLRMEDKLNLIMPYYNQLYKSALLEFNPFYDVDLNRTHQTVNNGTTDTASTTETTNQSTNNEEGETHNTGENSGTGWTLFSDTPQGGVAGINAAEDSISDNSYLTTATKNTNSVESSDDNTYENTRTGSATGTSESEGSAVSHNVEDYAERVVGKQGGRSYASLLLEFRKTFLNIDNMLMEELSDLFFGLWA